MPGYNTDYDVFYIPPNFIEGGTVFGGMLKLRNAIEAVILGLAVVHHDSAPLSWILMKE